MSAGEKFCAGELFNTLNQQTGYPVTDAATGASTTLVQHDGRGYIWADGCWHELYEYSLEEYLKQISSSNTNWGFYGS